MPENKTVPTLVDPNDFIASVADPRRRDEAVVLLERFYTLTGYQPRMWGPSIIGYGRYRYRYDTGHSGEHLLTGFSPRKSALTVYVLTGFDKYSAELARLGRHRHSVSCLYLTRLDAVNLDVLDFIITDSVARMRARYEHWPY